MMKKNSLLLIVFIISSCTTLNFWSDDDEDLESPKELSAIENRVDLSINWKRSSKGANYLGAFEPAFSGQEVFFADEEGTIRSLSRETGRVNWEEKLDFQLSVGVAYGFGKLAFSDNQGNLHLFDIDSKSIDWSSNTGSEVLANPVIDARFVVTRTSGGELQAYSMSTGERVWSFRSQLPPLTVRGTSSPILSQGNVISTFDNGRIGVFQLNTGFLIWDSPISYIKGASELENLIDSHSRPVVIDSLMYATNYQGNISIYDLAQQRQVWAEEASSLVPPLVLNNMIVVIQDNGSILSFSNRTLQQSWLNEDYLRRKLSNAVEFNGNILVGDLDGYLHIIDVLNGITLGRKKVSSKAIKSIVNRGDAVFVVDEDLSIISIN